MIEAWWAGRRVTVTGGNGAIGRRLVSHLLAQPVDRVAVLDRSPATGSAARVQQVSGSVLDDDVLESVVGGSDVVFHLAAITDVAKCADDPAGCFAINVLGTVSMLEACRRAGVRRVVLASTAHVYGVPVSPTVREEDPVRPLSAYAASKASAEMAVMAWAGEDRSAVIARLGNVYGPGLSRESVLGRACHQAATGVPLSVRTLAPIRDFLFVDDAAEALTRLAEPRGAGRLHILNVGSGVGTSIGHALAVVQNLVHLLRGTHPEIRVTDPDAADDVPVLVLDIAALERQLEWRPSTPLREGLQLTLQYETTPS